MNYKFRIKEYPTGTDRFWVQYTQDNSGIMGWLNAITSRGSPARFGTLEEARTFIGGELQSSKAAEPIYHPYP